MNEHFHPDAAGWLATVLSKLLPAGVGAAIMIAVDMPATKRELFMRVFVAMACSIVLGEAFFDYLDSTTWFSFLDPGKHMHHAAVNAVLGGAGWFVIGGAAMALKRFRADPVAAVKELKQ
jgi:predicted membrane channel-forming protein YqfA (hemolysin III family)